MRVRDIMTREVQTVAPDAPIQQIARKMRATDTGALPVVADGRLLGIVTDRDIVVRGIAENGAAVVHTTAEKVMSTGVPSCSEDQSIDKVKAEMQANAVRRVVVTDGEDRPIGILSIGDLAMLDDDSAENSAHRKVAEAS